MLQYSLGERREDATEARVLGPAPKKGWHNLLSSTSLTYYSHLHLHHLYSTLLKISPVLYLVVGWLVGGWWFPTRNGHDTEQKAWLAS
jgi:hypothetical protein